MTEINDPLAWVARADPDLKGEEYIGEFVISQAVIYLVSTAGQVREVDDTEVVFRP